MTAKQQLVELVDSLNDAQAEAGLRLLQDLTSDPTPDVSRMSGNEVAALLDSIPGFAEGLAESRQQAERGDTVPLSEL